MKSPGFKNVFNTEQEKALVEYILEMESCLMGITSKDVRRLAFDFAEHLKIDHPFNVKKGTYIKIFTIIVFKLEN